MWTLPPRRRNPARRPQAVRRVLPSLEGCESRLLLSAAPASTAIISGTTYKDNSGDGLSSSESTKSGVTVQLFKAGGSTPIASAVSDSSGNYSFTKLATGDYVVKEVTPAGWMQTVGGGGLTVDLTKAGQKVTGQDFDNFDSALYSASSVTGIKYTVTSPTGAVTSTTSLASVKSGDWVTATFKLSKTEPVWLVSYTAPNGTFNTANLQKQVVFQTSEAVATNNDTETVTVTVPNGYFQLDLVAGPVIPYFASNGNPNALYTPQGRLIAATTGGSQSNGPSTISGIVELTPAKGQKAGAPEANVPVTLSGYDYTGKQVKLTIYTKPDGTFSFTGLVASNWAGYRITVDLPVASAKDGSTGGYVDAHAKFINTFLNTNTNSTGNEFFIDPPIA